MSFNRLSKLRNMASAVGRLGSRLGLGRSNRDLGLGRSGRSVTERCYRHLAVDPLEQRQLLSVTPISAYDSLVNQAFGGIVDTVVGSPTYGTSTPSQSTLAGQSVAVDDDGDFVVVWTRQDPVMDPLTGNPYIDWNTGEAWSDLNVYARYYTDETQRITLPSELAVDNVGGAYGKFSLNVGGNEIQKLTVTSTYEPYISPQTPIAGQFSVGFDKNGNGTIAAGESFTMIFNESTLATNAQQLQAGLQGIGGALADVQVEALNAREYLIKFGNQSGGLNQPSIVINPSFTSFTSGFFPSAMISTVNEPITIANIPVSSLDAEKTAFTIEQIFLQTTKTQYLAPVDMAGAAATPSTPRFADWRISVTPVDGSLTEFDITFIGAVSKTDVPTLVVSMANDDLGTSYLGSSDLDVVTIKEPSPEFRVNDPELEDDFTPWPDKYDQYEPAVAMDADGDFVITWTSEVPSEQNNTNTADVYARRFRPAGWTESPSFVLENGTAVQSVVPLGGQFLVNSFVTGVQDQPAIGMDYDGNFTIAWVSTGQDISHFNRVGAQRYDRDGNRLGSEFVVVDGQDDIDTNIHFDPYVSMSDFGHILFTWSETTNPGYQNVDVYARLYAPGITNYNYTSPTVVLDTLIWVVGHGIQSTSTWDSASNFLISWNNHDNNPEDNDNIGATSVGVYAEMYNTAQTDVLLNNGQTYSMITGTIIKPRFRANSASLTGVGNTDWPGPQVGSQALLDADGDITITFDGYAPDASDNSILLGSYYTGLINATTNADLLPLFNPAIDALTPLDGITGDIDAEIEAILIRAVNRVAPTGVITAALAEQLGRLRAILESRADLLRGDANGILYSQFDASTTDPENVLASDNILNAYRDGDNTRYIIAIHRTQDTGAFVVTLTHPFRNGSQAVVITPVFTPSEVNPTATRQAIEQDLQNAIITGQSWLQDPNAIGDTESVDVRWVQLPELLSRDLTPWPFTRISDDYYLYEVTFQGECHDLNIGMSLSNSTLRDTDQGMGAIPPDIYQYEAADEGTIQNNASSGMEPDGDFVVAWTQWDRSTDGTLTNSNIYFRQIDEGTDTVGPRLTDFLQADGTRLKEDQQITGAVSYVIVTFDEELLTVNDLYPESNALLTDNWALIKDGVGGVEIAGGVSKVYFGMNKSSDPDLVAQYGLSSLGSNKWEAVLILDSDVTTAGEQPLGNGQYAVVAKHTLRDTSTNPLGRSGYDLNGQDVGREFYVLLPGGVETPVNDQTAGSQELVDTTINENAFPNSPQAIAGDTDSDYVVVWVDQQSGKQGVYAKLYTTRWFENADGVRESVVSEIEPINPATGLPWPNNEILVTTDATAEHASVARDADGDFIVTWSAKTPSGDWNVWYRRFDAMGRIIVGDTQEIIFNDISKTPSSKGTMVLKVDGRVTTTIDFEFAQDTASLDALAAKIQAELLALGAKVTVKVNKVWDTVGDSSRFNVSLVVRYVDDNSKASHSGITIDSLTWNSAPAVATVFTPPLRANAETDGTQRFAAVAMDTDGDFVITWQSQGQDGSGYGVYAQRFTRDGIRLGGLDEIQVLTITGDPDSAEFAFKLDGQVTGSMNYSGDLDDLADQIEAAFAGLGVSVEAWVPGETDDQVYIRFIDEDGRTDQSPILLDYATIAGGTSAKLVLSTAVEGEVSEFLVPDTTLGNQVFPSIAMDADGTFVISWTSFGQDGDSPYDSNIYAKQFPSNDLFLDSNSRTTEKTQTIDSNPNAVGAAKIITDTDDPNDVLVPAGTGFDGVVKVSSLDGMGSGSLLVSGRHILTAAHVVADAQATPTPANELTVTFNLPTGDVAIAVSEVFVHPDYNGNILEGSDLAILVLADFAPVAAERYDIYRNTDEIGQVFDKYGYGLTGTGQSGENQSLESGIRRGGKNRYEALGSFVGIDAGILVFDFDNGTAANDALGTYYGLNDIGLTKDEINTARGDSGGPGFINGLIAGVTSGGFEPGFTPSTDVNSNLLDSSYGEISIDVRVSAFAPWIDAITAGSTPEFRVNDTIAGDQKWSSVAMDLDGDFVITWTSYGQDGGGNGYGPGVGGENGVFAKRFTNDGAAFSDEFQVNTFTQENQQHSQVSMDADGDFVIVWESFQERPTPNSGPDSPDSYGIYAQRYARSSQIGVDPLLGVNGEIGGELHINGTQLGAQRFPSVTLDGTGDAIYVWTGNGLGDAQGIFTQRFEKPADDAGPIVTDMHNVLIQEGAVLDLEYVLNDDILYSEVSQFVVTFGEDLDTTYEYRGLHSVLNLDHWQLVRVMNDGSTQVMTDAVAVVEYGLNRALLSGVTTLSSNKYEAVITFDGDATVPGEQPLVDGKYILTIRENVTDLFGNAFDGNYDGAAGGDFNFAFTVLTSASETLVNAETDGDQDFLDEDQPIEETPNSPQSVDSDADGDYVVVWRSEGTKTGIYAQIYDAIWFKNSSENRQSLISEGVAINPATGLPWTDNEICVTDDPTATYASVAMDADGDFVVTWTAYSNVLDANGNVVVDPFTGLPKTEANVYAKRFDANGKAGVDEIQKITFSDVPKGDNIVGTVTLGFGGGVTSAIDFTVSQDAATWDALATKVETQLLMLGLDVTVETGDVWDANNSAFFNASLVVRFVDTDTETDQPDITIERIVWGALPVTAAASTATQGTSDENEIQKITFTNALKSIPTTGTVKFGFGGVTREVPIDFLGNDSAALAALAAHVQTELRAMGAEVNVTAQSTDAGDGLHCSVTLTAEFVGADAKSDQPGITIVNASWNPSIATTTSTLTEGSAAVNAKRNEVQQIVFGNLLASAPVAGAMTFAFDGASSVAPIDVILRNDPATLATFAAKIQDELQSLGADVTVEVVSTLAADQLHYTVTLTVRFVESDKESNQPDITVANASWTRLIADVDTETARQGVAGQAFRVNTVTAEDQKFSTIAMDHDGDFVITWQSEAQDGNGAEVYAQRYDRFGKALGVKNEMQVITFNGNPVGTFTLDFGGLRTGQISYNGDTTATAAEILAELEALGLHVEVEAIGDIDIEVRFIGADAGKNQPLLLVATKAISGGTHVDIVTTTSQDGKAGEFRVNQATEGDQLFPAVAMDAQGNFVVTWTSHGQDGDAADETNIYARQFVWIDDEDSDASDVDDEATFKGGNEFLVNQTITGDQRWSAVAMDMTGDFVITWTSVTPDPEGDDEVIGSTGGQDVFARRYQFQINAADNTPVEPAVAVGDEFQVNTFDQGTQQHSTIAMDANGDFVIGWESFQDRPSPPMGVLNVPNSFGVFVQHYVRRELLGTTGGVNGELGAETEINGTVNRDQRFPSVALDDTGDMVVVWSGTGELTGQEDEQGVYYRHFDEVTDVAGPTVTDVANVFEPEGGPTLVQPVVEGETITAQVTQFVVTFSEDLNVLYGSAGAHSVTNPQFWRLEKNGDVIPSGVYSVQFGLNQAYLSGLTERPSTKYEAVVTFDMNALLPGQQALTDGKYLLTVRPDIKDKAGNSLDGDLDGEVGNSFNFEFIVLVGEGGDTPVDPDTLITDGRTYPETPGAVDVDEDGDHVIVWTAYDTTIDRDRVYARVYAANGDGSSLLLPITPTTEEASDAFDGDIQRNASVALDADGDFIVTWTNYRDANGNSADGHEEVDVYARRFQADGTPMDAAFRVNTYTLRDQKWSSVAMDPNGDFVVTWSSYGQENANQFSYGIFARRYDMFGQALGSEFRVNVTTAGNQQFSSVAMDADGAFVVVWQSDQNGVGDDIVLREFTASGAPVVGPRGGEYLVNDTKAGNQRYPDVAMSLSGDNYAVTWSSSQGTDDQSGYGVYTKSFTRLDSTELEVTYNYQGVSEDFADGSVLWVPILVDQNFNIRDLNVRLNISHDDPSDLRVELIGPGVTDPTQPVPAGVTIMTLFDEVPREGDEDGYTESGPNGTDFNQTLLDDEADLPITDYEGGALPPYDGVYRPQQSLTIFDGMQAQGVWWLRITDDDPPSDPDIYVDDEGIRHREIDGGRLRSWSLEFTLDPVAASPEMLVNTTTEGNQIYSSVAMDHQGNFVVVWSGYGTQKDQEDKSQYGVFSQRFNAAASKQGTETRLNTTTQGMQWLPSAGMDGEGNFVAVWTGVGPTEGTTTLFTYVSANHNPQADVDGPIVSGVEYGDDGTVLLDGSVVTADLKTLIVAFGEDISTKEVVVGGVRTPALESILNPTNWVLQQGGDEIPNAVSDVNFAWNSETRRYEAEVTFDGNGMSPGSPALSAGEYTLTIRSLVEDLAGNTLDGDYDGVAGTLPDSFGHDGFHIQFNVSSSNEFVGPERRVSQDEEYYQVVSESKGTGQARETSNTAVAVDNDGDYVVVWTSYGQDDETDPNGAGVYFRLFDRNDNEILVDVPRVNSIVSGHQRNASVAMDADGDFVVVWESMGANGTWEVYSQRFDAAGKRVKNLRENRIDEDPNRNTKDAENIEVLVNSTVANEQYNPAVSMDDFGNFVVVWGTAGQDFSYFNNIFGQRFDYHGRPVGEEFQVDGVDVPGANGPGMVPDFRANPSVTLGNDGTFAVAWDQLLGQTSGAVTDTNVVLRLFDAEAVPTTDEIIVNADDIITRDSSHDIVDAASGGTDTTRQARNPQVVMGTDGGVIVVFEAYLDNDFDNGTESPDSFGVYYRRYDALGAPLTDGVQQANTVITDDGAVPEHTALGQEFAYAQVNPTIGIDADGDFAIFWNGNGATGADPFDPENPDLVYGHDESGVFGRWFSAGTDTILSQPTTVQQGVNRTTSGAQEFPTVAMEPDGDLVVVWSGTGVGDQHGVFSRRYTTTVDTAGPLATELRIGDAEDLISQKTGEAHRLLGDGDNVYGNPKSLLVVFDEALNVNGTNGLHSVLNVNNWALVNGRNEELDGAIHHVTFSFSTTLNKWVAEVFFSNANGTAGELANGTYTLVARTEIHDLMGNELGLTGYRPNGTGTILATPVDPEDPDSPTEPIPLDPITSQRGGFGFTFRVNSTVPGDAPWNDVDQQVNTDNDGIQDGAVVARNANGESVVVWVTYSEIPDPNADPDATDPATILEANIRAQRFDMYGRPSGEEIAVNSLTTGDQIDPDVAMDDQGNFVVVWSGVGQELSDETGIFAQRFDADGRAQGGQFRVNQYINSVQDEPAVAMNRNNGNFVVTWTSFNQDGNRDGVYAREFRATGLAMGNEFRVNTTTAGAQSMSDVAIDGTGRYVVTWASEEQDTSGLGVYAQRYTWGGAKAGSQFRVNTYLPGDQFEPAVAMNDHGWFVVVWTSPQDGSGYGVYAQRYNEKGVKLGSEFRVNQTVTHDQHQPAVSMANDVFVVAWTSFDQDNTTDEDLNDDGIYARMFNVSNGADFNHPDVGVVGEFQVNALTEGDQSNPDVAVDAQGYFSIVWSGQDADYVADAAVVVDDTTGGDDEPPRGGEPGDPIPSAVYWRLVDPPAEVLSENAVTEMVVQGTSGNDTFSFVGGVLPSSWIVTLNGTTLHVDSGVTTIRFVGGGGNDSVLFTGSSAADTAELWPAYGNVTSQYYTLAFETVESVTVSGGGGTDTAKLHDSAGDDAFTATSDSSSLTGSGFSLVANAFELVQAFADAGGTDTAKLYDTTGNDTLTTTPTSISMVDASGAYQAVANQFELAYGYSTAGEDTAKMYDSTGDDSLLITPTYARFTGNGFYSWAEHFRYVKAYATAGGKDLATMYGSSGDDVLESGATYAKFHSNAFFNLVSSFDTVVANGNQGGNDIAYLHGTSGNDTFVAGRRYGKMFGPGYDVRADFFRNVHGYGEGGTGDVAQLFDSEQDDVLEVYPTFMLLRGSDYFNHAYGFDHVDAWSTAGGNDTAKLHDSAITNELLEAEDNWVKLTSDAFSYKATAFKSVIAESTNVGDKKRIAPVVDFLLATEGLWQDE